LRPCEANDFEELLNTHDKETTQKLFIFEFR
jgi:hypothetical protein